MLRILVVEDEVIIRRMIVSQLEKCNATVVKETGNGDEAVEFVQKNGDVDFVCMDIHLEKGIDGITAAQQITTFRDIPILFISAYAEMDNIEEGINYAGYLHKPIDYGDLYTIINRHSTESGGSIC